MWIYDASVRYQQEGVPLMIIAGKEYGSGSSRDWAAKGVLLLGVRAVIAESFERIHRTNLVGMGVLPLQFLPGENVQSLKLTGKESYEVHGVRKAFQAAAAQPFAQLTIKARTRASRCRSGSIRRRRPSITAMAASCRMCSGSLRRRRLALRAPASNLPRRPSAA